MADRRTEKNLAKRLRPVVSDGHKRLSADKILLCIAVVSMIRIGLISRKVGACKKIRDLPHEPTNDDFETCTVHSGGGRRPEPVGPANVQQCAADGVVASMAAEALARRGGLGMGTTEVESGPSRRPRSGSGCVS